MNKNITRTMVVFLLALVPVAMGGLYAGETSGRSMTRVQYDNAHTGWNPDEMVLNIENVNPKTFGKKWEAPLDGNIKGAPLYVSGVMINGQPHNVVFVATSSNLIYALDADTGQSVWEK